MAKAADGLSLPELDDLANGQHRTLKAKKCGSVIPDFKTNVREIFISCLQSGLELELR